MRSLLAVLISLGRRLRLTIAFRSQSDGQSPANTPSVEVCGLTAKPDSAAAQEQLATVADGEYVIRLLFETEHILDGKVVPGAIAIADMTDRGISVDRRDMAVLDNIRERAREQMSRMPRERQIANFAELEVGVVRSLSYEGQTAFEVYASPLPGNPAHAHILTNIRGTRSTMKAVRALLIPHLANFKRLEELQPSQG